MQPPRFSLPSKNPGNRSRAAVVVPWLLVLLLVVGNLSTLASARVHAGAFKVLQSVLALGGSEFAGRVLAGSITREVQSERERVAQRALAARKAAARASGRLAERAVRSVVAIPQKAMPLAGIPIVIALTVADVKSDCETAADMNEMLVALQQEPLDTTRICQAADKVPSPADVWEHVKQAGGAARRKVMEVLERMAAAPREFP